MSDCRFGVSPVNYPDPDHLRVPFYLILIGINVTQQYRPCPEDTLPSAHLTLVYTFYLEPIYGTLGTNELIGIATTFLWAPAESTM